jgi:hypothetical protein
VLRLSMYAHSRKLMHANMDRQNQLDTRL